MKRIYCILIFLLCTLGAGSPGYAEDALDEALALVGLKRSDLGWEAKSWWPRWPEVPYKLRSFDRLFAAPLETIPFTRALAAAAKNRLDPDKTLVYFGHAELENKNDSGALFKRGAFGIADPVQGLCAAQSAFTSLVCSFRGQRRLLILPAGMRRLPAFQDRKASKLCHERGS